MPFIPRKRKMNTHELGLPKQIGGVGGASTWRRLCSQKPLNKYNSQKEGLNKIDVKCLGGLPRQTLADSGLCLGGLTC